MTDEKCVHSEPIIIEFYGEKNVCKGKILMIAGRVLHTVIWDVPLEKDEPFGVIIPNASLSLSLCFAKQRTTILLISGSL